MSDFWDQRYAEPGYKYGEEPNAYLAQQAMHWPAPLDVLVPGDGEGRNSVWLASQGHRVLAVDSSAVGLRKGQALADRRGVPWSSLRVDLAAWQPQPASVDAVVLIYVHLPSAVRREVHARLARALRPGGHLVLEAFHPRQLGCRSGGPKDVDMLVTLDDLRRDFAGLLRESVGSQAEVVLDEGPGHQGAAQVTRFDGRRLPP